MKDPAPREGSVKQTVKEALDARASYHFWPVQTGYGKRTVDCLACVPVTITKDMVGKTVGVFVAIETKRPKKNTVSAKQAETIKQVRGAGGVALMVNQVEDEAVRNQITWALRNGYVVGRLGQGG